MCFRLTLALAPTLALATSCGASQLEPRALQRQDGGASPPAPSIEVPPPAPTLVVAPAPPPAPAPASAGMVRIPAGTFLMGATDLFDDEKPPHEVTVAAFEIDLTEVTVAAYRACVDAGRCTVAGLITRPACNWDEPERGDHPINCVDWNQATAYCAFVDKRLPTEREWELAARGPEGRAYAWGDSMPASQLCWDGEGSDLGNGKRKGTCPVQRYPQGASPLGVLDLTGNVWEWTSSAHCVPESERCARSERVARGGGWHNFAPPMVRAAFRSKGPMSRRDEYLGFRCAR